MAADASELRPVRVGSHWTYRGVLHAEGSGRPEPYTSSARHVLGESGEVVEPLFSIYNQDRTVTQRPSVRGDTVMVRVTDPFGFDPQDRVDFIELRSPVRVNDQFAQLERKAIDTGLDYDGDHVADVADVATYRTVIGRDTVELPEVPRTLSAVRVDTTYRIRVTRSSDGRRLPVARAVESNWYAQGVGVVRRTLSAASADSRPLDLIADERLVNHDGVVQGLGATPPVPLDVSGAARAAVRAGDNVLAIVTGEGPAPTDLRLALLDRRGTVLRQFVAPGMRSTSSGDQPSLLSLGAQGALVVSPYLLAPGQGQVRLQRFDADGRAAGGRHVLAAPVPLRHSVAWDGRAVWFLWNGEDAASGRELMLQAFGLDGQPLAAAERLGPGYAPSLVASEGRLLATWVRSDADATSYLYGFRPASGAPMVTRVLGTVPCCSGQTGTLVPVIGTGVAAIRWRGPLLASTASGPPQEARTRGVVLDAAGEVVRTPGTRIDRELLPASWVDDETNAESSVRAIVVGERIAFVGMRSGRRIPGTSLTGDFVLLSVFEPRESSLARAAEDAVTLSTANERHDSSSLRRATLLVAFDTHVLVLGDNGVSERSSTSVFWLPPS